MNYSSVSEKYRCVSKVDTVDRRAGLSEYALETLVDRDTVEESDCLAVGWIIMICVMCCRVSVGKRCCRKRRRVVEIEMVEGSHRIAG